MMGGSEEWSSNFGMASTLEEVVVVVVEEALDKDELNRRLKTLPFCRCLL
jgi:hypothetical protein